MKTIILSLLLLTGVSFGAQQTILLTPGGTTLPAGAAMINANFTELYARAFDADITLWAGITPSANGGSLVSAANYAAMRTLLDLEAGTDFYSISAANAAFLAVGSLASPGPIGGTDPAAGSFTTLEASTPLGVASGGLGVSLVDPNADRVLFWDDSAGVYAYLTLGTNLSISGTTLNATGGGGSSMTSADLAGGTTLAVNYAYFDTISATRTFSALPTGTDGDEITITFDVTGSTQSVNFHTNSTVYRIGENGALAAALSFPVGSHKISLEKRDGKWFLLDSAGVGAESFSFAISDETTAITTGTAKLTWRAPYAGTITAVYAELTTASSSGVPAFDINKGGVSILSTTLTVDASETDSATAATPAVLSTTAFAARDQFTFDIDTAGTGAAGAKITILFTR